MTLPSKPVVIRLPAEANKRFEALCREFAGLPKAMIMRLLIESLLSEPLHVQVESVTGQIRKPATKSAMTKRSSERFESLNTNRRH